MMRVAVKGIVRIAESFDPVVEMLASRSNGQVRFRLG